MYDTFVPNWEDKKQAHMYNFWKRNTISWKLECEGPKDSWNPAPGESRILALSYIEEALGPKGENEDAGFVVGLVIGLIFLTAICTVASVGVGHEASIRALFSQFACMSLT